MNTSTTYNSLIAAVKAAVDAHNQACHIQATRAEVLFSAGLQSDTYTDWGIVNDALQADSPLKAFALDRTRAREHAHWPNKPPGSSPSQARELKDAVRATSLAEHQLCIALQEAIVVLSQTQPIPEGPVRQLQQLIPMNHKYRPALALLANKIPK